MNERVFQLASAILAASQNVSVEQAIRLAIKIIAVFDREENTIEGDDEAD